MRVALLSGMDPTARFLYERLAQHRSIDVLHIDWKPAWPHHGERWRERMEERLDQELFLLRDHVPHARQGTRCLSSRELNGEVGLNALEALEPDVVIVDGAPYLKGHLLAVPRLCTLNVHFGIAPEYRGSDTLFWALYERDWPHVGATIHHVDRELDGGRMLARLYPALRPGDDEAAVLARCARMAAEELEGILGEIEHGEPIDGTVQPYPGRVYRGRQREAWREAIWELRRQFAHEPPPREPHVERFWGPVTS
jgi:methionyl-tRNA formyltransferase